MERSWKAGAIASPPVHTENTAGNFPTGGNPGTGTPATNPGPWWFHMMTEEMRNVIVAAGLTPDKSDVTQFITALRTMGLLGGVGGGGVGQFKFPATQNASADGNTLDDYEEGSWTPVLGGAGGTSGQAYITQDGRYVKIGRWVLVYGGLTLSAKGTITGNVQISGLPFAGASLANQGLSFTGMANMATNWIVLAGVIASGTSVATVTGLQAAGPSLGNVTTADITNNTILNFFGLYQTNN